MCLEDEQEGRMQETTVVALKNCAASSQEAAFLIANMDPALALLKKLALQDVHSRISDVVRWSPPPMSLLCPASGWLLARRRVLPCQMPRPQNRSAKYVRVGRRLLPGNLKIECKHAGAQAMGAINSISRSPRAVPLLVQGGFRKEVLCNLLLSTDFEAAAELKKLTVAWFSLFNTVSVMLRCSARCKNPARTLRCSGLLQELPCANRC
jgi:hypothetical protein